MADQRPLVFNGFQIEFNSEEFSGFVGDLPDPAEMAARREKVGDTCALWHSGNALYGVPKVDGARVPDGMASTTLKVPENLGLVAFLINDTLPGAVPSYRAFRKWPFQFLGRRREFVAEIMRRLGNELISTTLR